MTAITTVNFHGNVLYGTRVGEVIYIALKPIVEAMGLTWQGQLERVKRDQVLSEGISVMLIPSTRGGPQETIGLQLDLIPGWLMKISTLRIKSEEIRAKVILFQRECYKVLAEHFLGRRGLTDEATLKRQSLGIRMSHEARLLFGKKAGAEVWIEQGLPRTASMAEPLDQIDLFNWTKRHRRRKPKP